MPTGLILAGHGSHISAETGGLIWRQVDALRALNAADEVTAAFWKEMPSFATVLDSLEADEITIVPLFTANGYFTQTVIPAEMGLTGAITKRGDGRVIRYTTPLGDHPYLQTITLRRVEEAKEALGVNTDEFAIAMIGHSTKRNPDSRRAAEAQANYLRGIGAASEVVAVYLDDTPEISEMYTLTKARNIIAVPYFLANGSHTTIDVPGEIGLQSGQHTGEINGRRVVYTPSVGAEDGMVDAILDLANVPARSLPARSASNGRGFPRVGRDQLVAAVRDNDEFQFGQLRITKTDVRVLGDDYPTQRIETIPHLRQAVRDDPFRPLATSRDLPRGWYAPYDLDDVEQLHAIIETIYPVVVADWAKRDSFAATSFNVVIQRQTGQYRGLMGYSREKQTQIAEKVCANCVRTPTWLNGERGNIPCKEPCNVWLGEALSTNIQEA